jgi:hypothetical protein
VVIVSRNVLGAKRERKKEKELQKEEMPTKGETKMKTFKILLFILSILLTGNFASSQSFDSFKPLSEPDGFRGIKWGTDISSLNDIVLERTQPNNIKVYKRMGDELRIGKARLEQIQYRFWMNKFYQVLILLRGAENWNYFKEAIFETFGKPTSLAEMGKMLGAKETGETGETYCWNGRNTTMGINYGKNDQLGSLLMESLIIVEKKKAYEQQKRIEQEKKATEEKARERGF